MRDSDVFVEGWISGEFPRKYQGVLVTSCFRKLRSKGL